MDYHARIVELAAAGKTRKEIAAAIGKNYAMTCATITVLGIEVYRPYVKKGPRDSSRTEKMASMYRQGLPLEVIGDHFGVTREWVRQILQKIGVSKEEGGARKRGALRAAARRAGMDAAAIRRWGVDHATMKEHRRTGLLRAFTSQRRSAKLRGIPWSLTFAQWLDVWKTSGKLSHRGRNRESYVMSRIKDSGGYDVGNVHIQLARDNCAEGVRKAHKYKANVTGVWRLYPGSSKPWIAKVSKKLIGAFATEEEAGAARAAFIAANPTVNCRKAA